jgi:hypothetical protein
MTQARITRPYSIAPDGHTTLHYILGSLVTGRVAQLAIADGAAILEHPTEQAGPSENKVITFTETKRPRGRQRKDSKE